MRGDEFWVERARGEKRNTPLILNIEHMEKDRINVTLNISPSCALISFVFLFFSE